jgi:hypothetical protein
VYFSSLLLSQQQSLPTAFLFFFCSTPFLHSSCRIDKLEYIVEDEITATLRHQLKRLRKVHRLLFFVNLFVDANVVSCRAFSPLARPSPRGKKLVGGFGLLPSVPL